MLDSAIHQINRYPVDTQLVFLILIRWIVIYPVDSAIQRLNNRDQLLEKSLTSVQQNRSQQAMLKIWPTLIWLSKPCLLLAVYVNTTYRADKKNSYLKKTR